MLKRNNPEDFLHLFADDGDINSKLIGTSKEFKYLPEILRSDEKIKGLASGIMEGKTWLVVCTNVRVILLDKGMFYGLQQIQIPLEKINSVSHNTGLVFGEIDIWHGANRMQIRNVTKGHVNSFVEALNRTIDEYHHQINNPPPVVTTAKKQSDYDKLEKLHGLMEKGIITEQEYQIEKNKILNISQ